MKTRTISSVVLGMILLVLLISGGYLLAAVLCAVSLIGFHEMMMAMGIEEERGFSSLCAGGYLGTVFHYVGLAFCGKEGELSWGIWSFLLVFFVTAILYVLSFPRYDSRQVFCVIFSFFYVPFLLSFIFLIRESKLGIYLAWVPFVAWVCDIFAYLCGRALGKRKLVPLLSPKKTVAGALGGILGAALVGMLFGFFVMKTESFDSAILWKFACMTLLGSILSQFGDLFASGIKRNHNLKDYGHLIPGHGGIMDRFDSVIFVTPFIYLMLTLFHLI